MDILAHGLWTNVIYAEARKNNRLVAVALGIAPDILSFGIFFIMTLFLGFNFGPPGIKAVPSYVFVLYNIWHSVFIWLIIFLISGLVLKRPYWPLLAPLIHIVIDVPLHDINFFPTPFLWPVSNYKFDGLSWGVGWFMILNYSLLTLVYIIWFILSRRRVVRG